MRVLTILAVVFVAFGYFLTPLSHTNSSVSAQVRTATKSRSNITAGDDRANRKVLRRARARAAKTAAETGCNSSGIALPDQNDSTFIVDCAPLLDTDCLFKDQVPNGRLSFSIDINRVLGINRALGDLDKLKNKGFVDGNVTLKLPAFDVDSSGGSQQFNPEVDLIFVNGHPAGHLTGLNNQWAMNRFVIPIEWLNFPDDPGQGGTSQTMENTIEIQIDTANSQPTWCTSIDWASMSILAARPIVFVHGIFSSGDAWNKSGFSWVNTLENEYGLPFTNQLNMGPLDSISNNAGKIADVVSASRKRWGVDKVNLVTHSKGGIDSREYVEGHDDVEQLIQLGTPNKGAPLADVAQGVSILTVGIVGTIIINEFAAPAGLQLTTGSMTEYNRNHFRNSKVIYTALAGDYDPNCSLFPFNCSLIGASLIPLTEITGPGDTIVPISSVYSLNYTNNIIPAYPSKGGDTQATHLGLNHSEAVFNLVKGPLSRPGTPNILTNPSASPSRFATTFSAPAPLANTSAVGGTIAQGQVQQKTIEIDQSTPTLFSMMYASGSLDLALISPTGIRFDANSVVGNPNVSHGKTDIPGGFTDSYSFNAPEVGIWTIEVTGTSVTAAGGLAAYAVTAFIQQPTITFTGGAERINIHANEPLKLLGTLRNGSSPLTGANVLAAVVLPDNSVQQITLHDDGANGDATANDGIYTGNMGVTSQTGTYRIAYSAHRSAGGGGPAFSRQDSGLATVSKSASTIGNTFRDFGVDSDGDELFNNLVIETTLNITAAGNYRVLAQLTDNNNNLYETSLAVSLSSGQQTVQLQFDGASIFKNRVNGPYHLKTIHLAEDTGSGLVSVDERTDAYQTAAYDFHVFQHPPIVLTGGGTAVGVDTNSNGKFDQLHVTLGLEVTFSDFYQWTANLLDSTGKLITLAGNSGGLTAGPNTITLDFDGKAIAASGIDGPYTVGGFLIFDSSDDSLIAEQVLTTSAFKANQFEGVVRTLSVTGGTPQFTKINANFALPLQAKVTESGVGVSGVIVTFTSPSSAATGLFGGSNIGVGVTNSSGVAVSPVITANGTIGSYTVTASITGNVPVASFNLTNTALPASISASSGTPQNAPPNAVFQKTLQAVVRDSGGTTMQGINVTFTAPATGASGKFTGGAATATVVTDANGLAVSPAFTANATLGLYVVTADVGGGVAKANFNLRNVIAGPPKTVSATAGTPQIFGVGNAFPTNLQATVLDAASVGVGGITVTFTIVPNGNVTATFPGNAITANVITDSVGIANAPILTANEFAGSYTVKAAVAGIATPATYALTNRLVYGDITGEGTANVSDLFVMANTLAGNVHLTPGQKIAADVLDDGTHQVNVQDLFVLANFLAGNVHTLPVITTNMNPGPELYFGMMLFKKDTMTRDPFSYFLDGAGSHTPEIPTESSEGIPISLYREYRRAFYTPG